MLPQLSLFQQCSIQSQVVMQTWLHWTLQHAQLVEKDFLALFHPRLNGCLRFDCYPPMWHSTPCSGLSHDTLHLYTPSIHDFGFFNFSPNVINCQHFDCSAVVFFRAHLHTTWNTEPVWPSGKGHLSESLMNERANFPGNLFTMMTLLPHNCRNVHTTIVESLNEKLEQFL